MFKRYLNFWFSVNSDIFKLANEYIIISLLWFMYFEISLYLNTRKSLEKLLNKTVLRR